MPYRFAALALTLLLAACGGGGGGGSDTSGSATPPTLRGVAATGAPLVNAAVSVVDGQGRAVGTATTHPADGSYSLTLSTTSPAAPLFIQARGMDATGAMQVLHSAVPTVSSAMVAHVTPLTNAVVALSLGTEPAPVFAAAASSGSQLAQLASTAPAASAFLKTLVKTQVSDLKFADATALDLLADATFAANKGAHDLLIESVRVDLDRSSRNVPVLQIGNKFLAAPTAEVVVELPTAQTELLKTAGTPANAITSTLKAATSATSLLGTLAGFDDLGAALNQLIAQGRDASTILAHPLLAGYDKHNSRTKADLAALLATYSAANRQFGRFQLMGCADDAPASGSCSRVLVGALISDSTGTVVDVFADAVSYNKAPTATTNKWNFIGNGKKTGFAVSPLAVRALNADGTANTAVTPNPGIGLQVEIQGQTPDPVAGNPGTQLLTTATVQLPGGFSLPFAYCSRPLLCVSSTPGATSVVPTGGVSDIAIQRAAVGWVGSADSVRAAKFVASYTLAGAAETRNAYLRADVQTDPAAARFPTLDNLSAAAPLFASNLQGGTLSISWATWAAANPDLRLIEIKRVFQPAAGGAPTVLDTAVPLPGKTAVTLSGSFTPTATVTSELWLQAQDSQGRRLHTRYTGRP